MITQPALLQTEENFNQLMAQHQLKLYVQHRRRWRFFAAIIALRLHRRHCRLAKTEMTMQVYSSHFFAKSVVDGHGNAVISFN